MHKRRHICLKLSKEHPSIWSQQFASMTATDSHWQLSVVAQWTLDIQQLFRDADSGPDMADISVLFCPSTSAVCYQDCAINTVWSCYSADNRVLLKLVQDFKSTTPTESS